MFSVHSTTQVDPSRRLAYWSDIVCDAYVQLECEIADRQSTIEGSIAVAQLATLCLTKVTSSAQRVHRTPSKIAQSGEDYFLISIQTRGNGVVVQDGREASLMPGDFTMYDSTRPYTLAFDGDFQQYVLMLPGRLLRTEFPCAEQLTANTVSGERGAGHLMLNMIHTLAGSIDTLAPESAGAIADSVRQILIAGLSTLPAAKQAPMSQLRLFNLERIRSCVRDRLREPGLTISSIAAELKVSPSTLHRTWGTETCSLGDWIWTQRLDAAYRDIRDPGLVGRSISEIAFSWGFNDAAHFSRAFRARFGCTPRELRPRSMTG
ncbi:MULTISPECIES: helix-turn-helix domain-containing protein [Burkholderia]|uniref:AraC-like ligand-binding domain-containing protein n=1 Tax=Burkholderia TaxID=32008 RepID=UPI0009B8BA9D|nr:MULTISPECIES: helix-turn-helix domain-containing protein [Burkholderia]